MFYLQKRMEISASHSLCLDYDSKCQKLHGHNWIITVFLKSETLNGNGMIMDFSHIVEKIQKVLDHQDLGQVLSFNPTAENIARWCQQQIGPLCYRVTVQETEGNSVTYEI